MDNSRVMVEFEISGDRFDPATLTEMLGVTPTKTRIKGETLKGKPITNKYTIWLYSTGYKESNDVNVQLKEIYSVFIDKIQILKQIKKLYDVEFTICIVIKIYSDEMPAISLDHWLIEFLYQIHAHVEFDTYVLN